MGGPPPSPRGHIPYTPGRIDTVALGLFADALEELGDGSIAAALAWERVWGPMPEGLTSRQRSEVAAPALRHPWLTRELDRRRQGGLRAEGITAQRVVQELARIAFVDPRKLVKRESVIDPDQRAGRLAPDGTIMTFVDLDELDEDTARAISSIEPVTQMGVGIVGYKVRFLDKLGALKALAEVTSALAPRAPNAPQVTAEDLTDDELALMLLELEGPTLPQAVTPEVLGPEGDDDD